MRAVLFAQGRTGSTLLESLLASTGQLRAHGELLDGKPRPVAHPLPYVLGLSRWHRGHFIFHVKVYQLLEHQRRPVDPGEFLRALHGAGWKIIWLRRENPLRHALSSLVAARRGTRHKFDDVVEDLRFEVDLEALASRVRLRARAAEDEVRALGDLPRIELVYERDLLPADRHQATADRTFRYLGLPSAPVRTEHRRVTPLALEELIRNYREFEDCVRGLGLEGFLDAPG